MKFNLATAIAASSAFLIVLPSHAATFFSLNQSVFKFNTGTSESELESSAAARINLGNTTIYIGTNQVSSNNQDPIVTSFTNGVRNWIQSYDTSGIDARGLGLLYDEGSDSLYGVFTADGGSQGANTFGAATQGGWLSGYGSGGGPVASVLLKLNPDTGEVEKGTFIRAELSNGRTNTVKPTNLDFVNDEVVFFGESFFTPLDTDGDPFDSNARTTNEGSPFDYRVVLSSDLSEATSAEAIGWNGLTAFTPLGKEVDEDDMADVGNEDEDNEDEIADSSDDDMADETDDEEDMVDVGNEDEDNEDNEDEIADSSDDDITDETNDEEDMVDVGNEDEDNEDEIADSSDDDITDETNDEEDDDDDVADIGDIIDEDNFLDNPSNGDIADEIDEDEESESVPEPGLVAGLIVTLIGAIWRKRLIH